MLKVLERDFQGQLTNWLEAFLVERKKEITLGSEKFLFDLRQKKIIIKEEIHNVRAVEIEGHRKALEDHCNVNLNCLFK
jgi:hypothetical protein